MIFDTMDYRQIRNMLNRYIERVGENGVVIGVSGGLDSALVADLSVESLGRDKVYGLVIPSAGTASSDTEDAINFCTSLGVEYVVRRIDDLYEATRKLVEIGYDRKLQESLDGRLRDGVLRMESQKNGLIYLGTVNGTEREIGYFPKGSLTGDYAPIGDVLKSQVIRLADIGNIPDSIKRKKPNSSRQISLTCAPIENIFHTPLEELDTILYFNNQMSSGLEERLERDFGIGREKTISVLQRVSNNRHKLDVFPEYPIINPRG